MEDMPRLDSACPRSLRSAAALGLVAALAVGCTGSDADDTAVAGRAPVGSSPLPTVPPAQPPAQLTRAKVDTAVSQLDGVVQDAMQRTGVPGIAVGVVYDGKVVYLKG